MGPPELALHWAKFLVQVPSGHNMGETEEGQKDVPLLPLVQLA